LNALPVRTFEHPGRRDIPGSASNLNGPVTPPPAGEDDEHVIEMNEVRLFASEAVQRPRPNLVT
jgi:hypothetical protein